MTSTFHFLPALRSVFRHNKGEEGKAGRLGQPAFRHASRLVLALTVLALSLVACGSDDTLDTEDENQQTIIACFPWSGTDTRSGLYRDFLTNIDSIKSAIKARRGMSSTRLMVFLSTGPSTSRLFEITYANGQCVENDIRQYTGHDYTTSSGIAGIIRDAVAYAPALNYAMIIGGHGTGWTFTDSFDNYPYQAKESFFDASQEGSGTPSSTTAYPTTRFYGSASGKAYATDVATLADGIEASGVKLQYLLFDACYMANAETAYRLRNATNFLIASTSEIISIGMPYASMWSSLATATPAYASAVRAFDNFYSNYTYPYGALSVIDCRQMDNLAAIMKEINAQATEITDSVRDSLQVLDGFRTPIFYDFADYATTVTTDLELRMRLQTQLTRTIRASASTDYVYSNLYSNSLPVYRKVNTYSGLTISDPSLNSVATATRERTAWWKATH